MSTIVREADLGALRDVIDAGRASVPPVGLPAEVLHQLRVLVPCDLLSFIELDFAAQATTFDQTSPTEDVPMGVPGDEVFWRHYADDLCCSYPTRTRDERSVFFDSDFYSIRELHSTPMYCEYSRYFGTEHEAIMCLSSPPGVSRRLLLGRGPGRDFDERDRLLLSLVRPHLSELYQEIQRARLPSNLLTARQRELLRLAALGRTNAEIARELFISTETVRKHLENVFTRLGVGTRTAAVARAFPSPPW